MGMMSLEISLHDYSVTLADLEAAEPQPSAQQVLAVLHARDNVADCLKSANPASVEQMLMVLELDKRLKQQTLRICQAVKLTDWRPSFHLTNESWWWFLEVPPNKWDRFDWLWGALTILCLTISLGLLADISSRFLSGGPDTWASMAVVGQSMLALLAAGGALTLAGREAVKRILTSWNVPEYMWQEAKFVLALGLMAILIFSRLSLPEIAVGYNNRGLQNYVDGNLTSARFDYQRAIKLNPDYIEAHYNLALLYEDLQQTDDAEKEYLAAVQGGLDAAYNNLARLYILKQNYGAAVPLLKQGLFRTKDDAVKYDLYKNLGWARLGQARYEEAVAELQSAIALGEDRAAAHCLLAQAFEGQNQSTDAQDEWNLCLAYADPARPDEDTWIGMAREHLREEGK
jgi:tetratricopeptide (TPR) repeat protein